MNVFFYPKYSHILFFLSVATGNLQLKYFHIISEWRGCFESWRISRRGGRMVPRIQYILFHWDISKNITKRNGRIHFGRPSMVKNGTHNRTWIKCKRRYDWFDARRSIEWKWKELLWRWFDQCHKFTTSQYTIRNTSVKKSFYGLE